MGKITDSRLTAKVLKALGLFGTVQVLQLLCAVVRTKLVALWVGAAGVGILGLYQSGYNLFKSLSALNIGVSTVPSLAGAPEADRPALTATVMRMGVLLGTCGALLMAALSPLLSLMSFGTAVYAWGFALLAPAVLFSTAAEARSAVLQGLGQLRTLGKASLVAVVAATAVALPLVYFFRIDAIVPMIVIYALSSLLFLLMGKPRPSLRRVLPSGEEVRLMRRFASQGAAFTVAMAMGFGAEYVLRAWLNYGADIDTVGMFQAGSVIVGSYLGMVFTAISMEFYPRLSATISSPRRTGVVMSHEISLVCTVMLPMILVFMSADSLVVKILYSSDFEAVGPYIIWAAAGTAPRAAGWCMSYALLARGDTRAYMLTESTSAVALLVFSYIGWHLWGLAGLGVAYALQMTVFCAAVWAVCRRRLGLRLGRTAVRAMALCAVLGVAGACARLWGAWWAPLALAIVVAAAWNLRRRGNI